MCAGKSRIEIKIKYTIDDLPRFFRDRSKAISKKFSNKRFKISTIRSKNMGDHNEFSFYLKLPSTNDKNTVNKEQFLIKPIVDFFRICLFHGEDYKINIIVPEKSRELYDIHCANNSYSTVEQFINGAPSKILSNGIRIELKTNIKDIDLSKLNQIDLHLSAESLEKEVSQGTNGKLISDKRLKQSENKEESNKIEPAKKETKQKKQIVLVRGQFGLDITNSQALPYPPVSKPVTVTKKDSEEKENHNTESKHIKVEPIPEQQIEKSTETSNGAEIKGIIERAHGYAETEIILNENGSREKPKTLDEIFCEAVIEYYNPRYSESLTKITESVFKAVFLQGIPEKGKRLEEDVLNVLKKFGLEFNRNNLIKLIAGEKFNLQHCNKHTILYKEKSAIRKLYDEFRSYVIVYRAQKKARKAIKNNNDKTRNEILTELIQEYSNQDSSTFTSVVNVVLYEVFCNGKDPSKIETFEEVFCALRALEVQFNEEYLESSMRNKKDLLDALVRDQIYIHEQYKKDPATSLYQYIYIEPTNHSSKNEAKTSPSTVSLPTGPNTRLESRSKIRRKLMLENIFYSPETYFYLFSIVAFISTLYLWHFPPIWMAVLKELMPPQKRDDIELVLNIGLPILIMLCTVILMDFIYSEYSGYVKFVEQENTRNLQPSLEP